MNFLVDQLQKHVTVGGEKIKIATSFRLWLLYLQVLKEQNPVKINIALKCICSSEITDELLQELKKFAFMSTSQEEKNEFAPQEDVYFEIFSDEQLIIADFMREYHIDLLNPDLDMHWHRFKILLDNLSDKSCVSARIRLRQIPLQDVNKKDREKVRKAKARYQIKTNKTKLTLEQRNANWKKYVNERVK